MKGYNHKYTIDQLKEMDKIGNATTHDDYIDLKNDVNNEIIKLHKHIQLLLNRSLKIKNILMYIKSNN